jgi:hypothetical protein
MRDFLRKAVGVASASQRSPRPGHFADDRVDCGRPPEANSLV